jgi:transcriptional regulator with XRE-family HTH domain
MDRFMDNSPAARLGLKKLRKPVVGRRTRMKAMRLKNGLSVRDVAKGAGLSSAFVSQAENGRSELGLKSALRLAEFFGVRPEELLEEVKEEESHNN